METVSEWYINKHPSDMIGKRINSKVTWPQLRECVMTGASLNALLGEYIDTMLIVACVRHLVELYPNLRIPGINA